MCCTAFFVHCRLRCCLILNLGASLTASSIITTLFCHPFQSDHSNRFIQVRILVVVVIVVVVVVMVVSSGESLVVVVVMVVVNHFNSLVLVMAYDCVCVYM